MHPNLFLHALRHAFDRSALEPRLEVALEVPLVALAVALAAWLASAPVLVALGGAFGAAPGGGWVLGGCAALGALAGAALEPGLARPVRAGRS